MVDYRFIKSRSFVEGLSKTEFKELLSLAAKGSYFVFNGQFYKHTDGSLLGPTMANAFLVYLESNWLQNFSSYFKPYYNRRYVDNIFVLFSLPEHLEAFLNFLKGPHGSMSFRIKKEKQNRMYFLALQIIHQDKTFTTSSVYLKPTLSGVYTHFDSILSSTCKSGTVYTL